MTEARARHLAWSAFSLWVLFLVGGVILEVAKRPTPGRGGGTDVPFLVVTAAFPVVAILILTRQPRNRVGWILMAIGLAWVIPLDSYGGFALSRDLPGGALFVALSGPTWAPPILLMGTTLLLRFPNGDLLSPRWRKVEWVAAVALTLTVAAILLSPGDLADSGYPQLANPLGVQGLRPLVNVLLSTLLLIPITIVASAVGLVLRFRRSTGAERLQMKWLTTASAMVAAVYLVAMVVSINYNWLQADTPTWVLAIQAAASLSFGLIPLAIAFAVLRYRLYEIDVVINKAVVYGSMAAFITGAYVVIVVGVGRAVGSDRSLGLSVLATASVALGFQPVRERVQRFANRLVYGTRATPYEALSELSGGMAHAVATDELLPRMARIAAQGTGAARVDVWLHVGPELVREASWPEGDVYGGRFVPGGGDPDGPIVVPGADAAVIVRHLGEVLGVIGVKKPRGETLTPTDGKLLDDLASQAGLVLRNVRLIENLRTSRQRLVTAQDEERRRLERDLHDGAQQRLVALALALRMARGLVRPDADPALGRRLDMAAEELANALSELREFARGVHPAILTERGLVPALVSLAERSPVPATVESTLEVRLPAAVEATAYFVVSEALANTAKYADATEVAIRVEAAADVLTVEVADDGRGGADLSRGSGLVGLVDRVAVIDGVLEVDSPPGKGTRVRCLIPVPGPRTGDEAWLVPMTADPARSPA